MEAGPHPLEAFAHARLGRVLRGKYRLDAVLGVGGMATVYAATHRNGRRFAIKVLHPQLSLDESLRERFQREGMVANSVSHPGAVAALDDDVDEDGAAFLVLELLDGAGVDSLWARHGRILPCRVVCALADQLLDVLKAAHERSIVHRDVKPANLYLTQTGELKVLDFGIARVRDTDLSRATLTGTLLGTPAFMPPEQASGRLREIGTHTDVWATGATLFTLLSGHEVHEAETPQLTLVLAATRRARSLRKVAPRVPAQIAKVVDRALDFEPPRRFPDAHAMQAALRQAYGEAFGLPLVASPRSLAEWLEAQRRAGSNPGRSNRHTRIVRPLGWHALASLLLALAFAIGWWTLR